MISYGGVNLICPTVEMCGLIERALSPRQMRPFEDDSWPGPTRIAWGNPDMPPLPPVRVGVLSWPRDAQRFAVGYFLASSNQLNAIRAQLSTYQALPFTLSQENPQGQTVSSITTSLWMLPAQPIWQLTGRNGLYLLTLVDDRYWWPQRDTGELPVTAGTTTWAQLYAGLATALGVPIAADAIPAAYLQPSVALTARYEQSPALLDAVARNVGQRIVRDLAGNVYALAPTSSSARLAANVAAFTPQPGQVSAGGSLAFSPGIPGQDLAALLPGSVRLTFPVWTSGGPTGDVYPITISLASLGLADVGQVGNASTKTFHDTCTANGATPSNNAELTALAQQQATDWYRSLLASWDGKLDGIVPWTVEGLSDSIEWTYRKHDVSTRIHRPPWNDLDEQLLHGSATVSPASLLSGPPPGTTILDSYLINPVSTWNVSETWDLTTANLTWLATGSGSISQYGIGVQWAEQGVLVLDTPVEICGVQLWCCCTVSEWLYANYPGGDVNDWYVSTPATVYRVSSDSDNITLTGIAPFNVSGTSYPQIIALVNVGSHNITLTHQDPASQANNRFTLPGNAAITLKPNEVALCWYDTCQKAISGTGTWRVLAGSNTFMWSDGSAGCINILKEYTNATTATWATVFDVLDSKGLHGSYSVKNTGVTNAMSLRMTATDAYGTSVTQTLASIAPGGNKTGSMVETSVTNGTTTIYPPYKELKMEVEDATAGNHTTYDVWLSLVGTPTGY